MMSESWYLDEHRIQEIAMKLYYAPGACSLGIHLILEEIGKPYDLQKVDLQKQEQYAADFIRINPKSKVPTLVRDDGSVLTQFPAIATWLARTNPEKSLLPSNAEAEARAIEAMDYVISTMHMQGFSRMFRPVNYAPSETDHERVKARGKEIMEKGLELMNKTLEGKDYLASKFTIADAALFYVEFWASRFMKLKLPKNCAAHYERMKNRPAVKRVLDQEGLSAAA
jgi:glutathione S-transferase